MAARFKWGRSSVGRAPALQAGGQEFESLRLHCELEKKEKFTKKYLTKTSNDDIIIQQVRNKSNANVFLENRIQRSIKYLIIYLIEVKTSEVAKLIHQFWL